MKRTIAAIFLAIALLATLAACGSKTTVTLVITMPNGSQNIREIKTNKETLGEALRSEGLIECDEEGTVISVEGTAANWNEEQTYWAFEVDGGYVNHSIDEEIITAGKQYALVFSRG